MRNRNRAFAIIIILISASVLSGCLEDKNKDSDGDGLSDYLERNEYHTDSNNPDTSGDGILDSKAIELGLNPTQAYPLVGYGYEKGLEDAVLKELVNVSDNQSTHAFVDYLTRLYNTSALYLAQHFLEDKKLNETESNQIKFLSSLKKIPSLISKLINFDWDKDKLTNYEEEKLGTNYTNNDTSGDGISDGKAVELGLNPTIKYNSSFVTLLSKLDSNEQKEFIRKFVENNVSRRGLEQAIFLNSLSSNDFQYFRNNNLITNQDIDNDEMSNFFEKFEMKLPWNITNNRYFIYLTTDSNSSSERLIPFEPMDPWGDFQDQQRYLIYKYKFNPSKVYSLLEENATFEKFSNLISRLSNILTQNDLIYIQLNMHGAPGHIKFNDKRVNSLELNKILDNLHSNRVILSINSCGSTSNETLNPLANGTSPRVVMGGEDTLLYARLVGSWGYIFNRYLKIIDMNNDHRISMEESFYNKFSVDPHESSDVRDTNKLFDTTFLGDATIEELHVDVPLQP